MAYQDYVPDYVKGLFRGWWNKQNRTVNRAKNPYGMNMDGTLPDSDDPLKKWYTDQIALGQDRYQRYTEYEVMDAESVEIHTALDHYANNATQMDFDKGATVWVESPLPQIKAILNELLHDRLEIEDHIWGITRSLAKYGDLFRKLVIDVSDFSKGILHWIPEHPRRMIRLENLKTGELEGFKYSSTHTVNSTTYATVDTRSNGQKTYKPWDFVHFRLLGDMDAKDWSLLYGQSMLAAARPIWKRLKLLEEALAIYRLTKAPDRFVYYVDTGELSPEEAWDVVKKWKRLCKRNSFINPSGGTFNQPVNPAAFDEDIFWPVAKDNSSRIDKLQGGVDVTSIADLDYFRQKMYMALKIPVEYMSGQASAVFQFGPGSLAQKDMEYAKAIKRLQRAVIQGLTRICEIHLAWLDIDPSERRFQIKMANISGSDEEQRLNNMSTRLNVASQFSALTRELEVSPFVIRKFVVKRILGLDGELADDFLRQVAPPPPSEPPLGGQELPSQDSQTIGPNNAQQQQAKAQDTETDVQQPQEDKLMAMIMSNTNMRDKIKTLTESLESMGEKHERIYGSGIRQSIPNAKVYKNLTSEELDQLTKEMEEEYKRGADEIGNVEKRN